MHILGSLVLLVLLVYNYSSVYCYKDDYGHYSGEEPFRIHGSDSSGFSGDSYGHHPRKAWDVAYGKLWKKSQRSLSDEEKFGYDHHHEKREVHLPKMHDDYGNDEEYAPCPHQFDVGIWKPGSLSGHRHHPEPQRFNSSHGWKRNMHIHNHLRKLDDYGNDEEYADCPHQFNVGIWEPGSLGGHRHHSVEHNFNGGNGWKRWHTNIHKHLPKIEDDYGNAEEYAKCPHEFDVGIWNPGSMNSHHNHPSEHTFNGNNGWKREIHVHDELRKMEDFGAREEYAECPHEFGIGLWKPGTMGLHHGHPSSRHHQGGGMDGGGSFYDKRNIHENLVIKHPASKRKSSINHQIAGQMNGQPHNSLERNIKCYHEIMRRRCQRRSKCRPRSPAGYWELSGLHDPVRHAEHTFEGGHYPEHRGSEKRYRCKQPIVLKIHAARSNVSSVHSQHNESRRSNVTGQASNGDEYGGIDEAPVVGPPEDAHTLPKGRWIPEPNEETPLSQTQEDAHSVDDSDYLDDGEQKYSYKGLNRNGTIKTYDEFDNSAKNFSQTEPGNFFVGNGSLEQKPSTDSEQVNTTQDIDPEAYGDYDDNEEVEGGENSKLPLRYPVGLKTPYTQSSRMEGNVDAESPHVRKHDDGNPSLLIDTAESEPLQLDGKSPQATENVGEKSPEDKAHDDSRSPEVKENVESESPPHDSKSPQAKENVGEKSPQGKEHVDDGSPSVEKTVDGESSKVKANVDGESPKVKKNDDGESHKVKENVDGESPEAKENGDGGSPKVNDSVGDGTPQAKENVDGESPLVQLNINGGSPHLKDNSVGESPQVKDNVNGHNHPSNRTVVEVDDVNREILRNASEVDITIKKEKISKSAGKGKKSLKKETDDDSRRTEIVNEDSPYEDDDGDYDEGENSKMPMSFPVGLWKPGSQTPDDFDYGDNDNNGANGRDEDHRPSHESHNDYRPSHDEHSDHRPFHDDHDERPYADERRPSHDNFDERRPSHDNLDERRPSHDNFDERRPSHDNFDERRPSHDNFDDHRPYHDDHDDRPYDNDRPSHDFSDDRQHDNRDERPYDEERPSRDNDDEPRPYHNYRDEGKQYHDRGYNRTIKSKRKSMIQRQNVDGTVDKYSRAIANSKSYPDSVGDSTRRHLTHKKKKRHYIRGKPKSIIPDDRNISGNASRRSWFHPMHFEGSILDKFKKHWAELENGGGNDDKEEESFESKKKDKPSAHRPRLKVMKSINHNMPEITAKRVSRRHHRKHLDTKFSSRDKDAGEVPEEIMRTLNFPKKIYPGEASIPQLSTSGDDPAEYTFDDKTAGSGGNSALASDKVLTGSKKLTKDKIYDSVNEKRVFPLDSGESNGKVSSKDSIENRARKRRHKHRHSTSERRRLHDYNDNDYDNEDVRTQKDDGGDEDDEDKDDMERNIERKEKEIQEERLRNYKSGEGRHEMDDYNEDGKSERKSGTDDDEDIREMEEKEQKNTKHLHHPNKKRMRDHDEHYNIDNDDDDDGDDDNKHRYHPGNYRFKAFHEVPHHGVERFGRKNEEITINDASREGDVDQLDVESRLSEGSNNLPNQDILENEKLSDLDRSFSPVSSYSKDRGRSDEGLRHMYGMEKSERDEDTPLRSHHHKMVEDSEENEERLPEESHKRYHEKDDRYDDKDDDDRDDDDDLKEKLYRELKEREQAMREREESDFRDDEREGNEEEDDVPEREKSYDEPIPRKHYDDDEENYAEDEGKKRYHLNRLASLTPKVNRPSLRHKVGSQDTKEFSVLHAESLLDHLQDEALANQKKLNFQQTSGQITNKGELSLAYLNANNGGGKPKHTKMKRHELFLAPHRRNFNSKKTNSTYTTIAHFLEGSTNVLTKPVGDESGKVRSVQENNSSTQINRRQLVFQTFFSSKSKEPRSIIRTYRIYSKRQAENAEPLVNTAPLKVERKSLTLIDNSTITLDASASRDFDPDELGT